MFTFQTDVRQAKPSRQAKRTGLGYATGKSPRKVAAPATTTAAT
jgi:hypothetical protein